MVELFEGRRIVFGALRRQRSNGDARPELLFDEIDVAGFHITDVVAGERTGNQIEIRAGDRGPISVAGFGDVSSAVAGELVAPEALCANEKDPFELAVLIGEPVHQAATVEDVKSGESVDFDHGPWVIGAQ